jgi:hypothetical protein
MPTPAHLIHTSPGEGPAFSAVGDVYRILATGDQTGGVYALCEARVLLELDDMAVAPDGGTVMPSDGGVNPGADGGVSPGADGGGPTPDAGMTSTDRDPDRDGVESARDVCPAVFDPEQRDFDTDGRGDACDACPETMAGLGVDADGCAEVSAEVRDALDAILAAILARRFDAALDQDGDGKLDAVDFVLRARAGGVR